MLNHDSNPFASPRAEDSSWEATGDLEMATRISRLLAAIVDGLIMMVVFIPLMLVLGFGMFSAMQDPGDIEAMAEASSFDLVASVVGAVLGIGVYAAINGYFLHTRGQTIGKMALGIMVVRKNGDRADFARLLGPRYALIQVIGAVPVVGSLFILVNILMIFRKSRYCLHDDIADTAVVVVPKHMPVYSQ